MWEISLLLETVPFQGPRMSESACEKLNPGSQEPSGRKSPRILGQVCKKGKTSPVNRNIKPPEPGTSAKHIRKRPSLWAAWEGGQHLWGLYGHRKAYSVNSRSHNSTVIKKMGSQIATPIHPLLNTKTNSTSRRPTQSTGHHDTLPHQAIVRFTQACVLWGAWLARKQRSLWELADSKESGQLHNF